MAKRTDLKAVTTEELASIIAFRQAGADALLRESTQAQRAANRARRELKRRKVAAKAVPMPRSLVVYGPMGCGKTRNAQKIAHIYGLHTVVEADEPGALDRVKGGGRLGHLFLKGAGRHGHLFLTNDECTASVAAAMSGANVLHYDTLASIVEGRRNG